MPDDKSKRGRADQQRISVGEPYEVSRLAKKVGLPYSLVENVARKEGPMRSDIEAYLNRMKRNGRK